MTRSGAMRVASTLLAVSLGACGSTPQPQQPPPPSSSPPAVANAPAHDPQSTYEPRSEPGEGQKLLQRMVGDFDVDKRFHGRDGGVASSHGECHQTMIQDGRFLESRFVFQGDQGTSTGLGLIGYDSKTGQFTSVWIDSRSTRMSMRQSETPATTDELVLHSKSLDPSPTARHTRTVTKVEAGGARILHRQYSPNPDGSERLVMELVLTRKANG